MNQYTTKIWKYDSNTLFAIQFGFLNRFDIYYYPEKQEWFGVNKHHEPINPKEMDVLVKEHDLKKEALSILLDHTSDSLKDASEAWRYMNKKLKIVNDNRRQGY